MLETIYKAMKVAPYYLMVDPKDVSDAIRDGWVELNTAIENESGMIAARLTPSGVWEMENNTVAKKEVNMTETAPETASPFSIVKGGFEPPVRKKADRTAKFPFDGLEVGDYFFVPDRTAKSFASTVTAANKRHSEPTGEMETFNFRGEEKTREKRNQLRKFAAVDVEGGINVGRVA